MSVTPFPTFDRPQRPVDMQAEQCLLGALMVNNAAYERVSAILRPEHFGIAVHERIYTAIVELAEAGAPADAVTIKDLLGPDPFVQHGGVGPYMSILINSAVTVVNAPFYARMVIETAKRRALFDAGFWMIDASANLDVPIRDVEQTLEELRALVSRHDRFDPDTAARLVEALDINTWSALDLPPEPKLLGDLITPTARIFLVGRTGLGKTLILQAMCGGMARGQGFCHWRSERASRWLIIDGEMPTVLIKQRGDDLLRRGGPIPPGNLVIYSLDRAEEFARMFPGLGMPAPLNTDEGHRFVMRLVDLVKPDGVAVDNIMSMIAGDQKDEIPWSGVLPIVSELTRRQIAQIYLDHAGHNTDRQYGSSTKQWRMDAVGIMTPLGSEQNKAPGEVAFNLSFEPPAGKARRKRLENLTDFADVVFRMTGDQWFSEPASGTNAGGSLSPKCRLWHSALLDALTRSQRPGRTTRTEWYGEAVRTALAEALRPEDNWRVRDQKTREHRKIIAELRHKNFIGVDGETIIYLINNVSLPAPRQHDSFHPNGTGVRSKKPHPHCPVPFVPFRSERDSFHPFRCL